MANLTKKKLLYNLALRSELKVLQCVPGDPEATNSMT